MKEQMVVRPASYKIYALCKYPQAIQKAQPALLVCTLSKAVLDKCEAKKLDVVLYLVCF